MQTFTCEKPFIDRCGVFMKRKLAFNIFVLSAVFLVGFVETASAEWKVDFSRRVRASREAELNDSRRLEMLSRSPASAQPSGVMIPVEVTRPAGQSQEPAKGVFDTIFDQSEPVQDIVILHTEKGFVPSAVRVRKNGRYRIHVVNVNAKEKNVSFILDGFAEHHATFYGQIKVFNLEPKTEGTYSFQSPETSSEGQVVVFNPEISLRAPASAGSR